MPLDMEDMDTSAPAGPAMVLPPGDGANMDESIVAPPPMLSPVASLKGSISAPGPMGPPAGPVPTEIAFSFDTTGSMSSCLEEVQNHLKTIINRLFMDIPALKIGIFAHGDYCDEEHFYVTKHVDFTNDVNALMQFVTNCGGTGGGDYEECYELVLKKVREDLSWTPGTTKSLVMIGDAIPHPQGHGGNNANLDWREELDRLHGELGVRVYAVQCMVEYNKEATPFWEELSKRSFGKYLEMNQFATVIDLMMAICYREGGNPGLFEAYEREVRAREGPMIGRELDRMFITLRDGETGPAVAACSAISPRATPKIAKGVAGKKKTVTKAQAAVAKAKPAPTRQHKVTQEVAKKIRGRKLKAPKVPQARLLREKVSNAQFSLNDLRWCPWMYYRSDKTYRNTKLFRQNTDKPAVYEVAVQTCDRAKHNVVFCCATKGIRSGVNWDTYILRKPEIKEQLKNVLAQGCKVHVRRALLPKVVKVAGQKLRTARAVSGLLRKTYDYAWLKRCRTVDGCSNHGRDLYKGRIALAKQLNQ